VHDPNLRAQIEGARAYEALHVPAIFEQWAVPVLEAAGVGPGHRVLDVACGTGVLARKAAERVGDSGQVFGVDPGTGMLAVARELAPEVEWRQGTAESLPFPDGGFDAVVSQFGLMFFLDRPRAVAEMLRVVVPGGRLAVAVWESLERSEVYPLAVDLLERRAGREAADALRAPFVLGDTEKLRALFEGAGVSSVKIETQVGAARFPSVRTLVEADLRGWLPIMGVFLEEDLIQAILAEAEEVLASYVTPDGQAVFKAPAHIVSGTRA
jgi:ubiquinone/menaquinone biosynthesis C-methylase UbiE